MKITQSTPMCFILKFLFLFQVHQGLLCCYCTKLFKKVSDLETHIKSVHRVSSRYYHNAKQFASISGQKYNFVCSICSETITLKNLNTHGCKLSSKKHFDCPFCAREFQTQSQLDIHLSNGWCKEMQTTKSIEESRKVYKVSFFDPLLITVHSICRV